MMNDSQREMWLWTGALVLVLVMALVLSSCAKQAPPPVVRHSAPTPSTTPRPPTSAASHGLTPGNLPAHWNSDQLLQVDKTGRDFTFAVFGDNRGSSTIFPALIRSINSTKAIFALDNGDLVDSGTVGNYRLFLDQISASTKPFLTAMGNHEDASSFQELFGPTYYDFAIGESIFIVLDDSNGKNIDPQQMAWLTQKLVEGQSKKYRFVIMHVPLYDPRLAGESAGHSLSDLDFTHGLNNLFDQYRVTMLITSHVHGYYEGVWGTTPYIMTAGAGAALYGSDPAHFFYHYVLVHVSPSGVTHEIIKIQP